MSSRVVTSRFANASRYARKRSASAGGPVRGSLAASCPSATDKSTQLRVASKRSCLMGRLLPGIWGVTEKLLVTPRVAGCCPSDTARTGSGSSSRGLGRHPNAATDRQLKTGHRIAGAGTFTAAVGSALAAVANVLSVEKRGQVIALGRLGWSLRRIEETTGGRRAA